MSQQAPIVVGTDLSPSADEAVTEAVQWAARVGAPLIVVHVAPERLFAQLKANEIESSLRARLGRGIPGDFDLVLRSGSAHAELMAVAGERQADLLVVGASGSGAVERALFGSTAEQVVRYAHCPVLVARPSPRGGPLLTATDFSEAAYPALKAASLECSRRSARLLLLHSVYEPPSPLALMGPLVISAPAPTQEQVEVVDAAARETLATLLEGTGVQGDVVISHESPASAIVKTATEKGASLVVVGTRGRTGLARIALGSVAESVVQKAPCSVLAVRAA